MKIKVEFLKEEGRYRVYRLDIVAGKTDFEKEQKQIIEYFENNKIGVEGQMISSIVEDKIKELNTGQWYHDLERVHDQAAFT